MSELPPCRHEGLRLESIGYAIGHWVCKCGWSTDANCLNVVRNQAALVGAMHRKYDAMLLSNVPSVDVRDVLNDLEHIIPGFFTEHELKRWLGVASEVKRDGQAAG